MSNIAQRHLRSNLVKHPLNINQANENSVKNAFSACIGLNGGLSYVEGWVYGALGYMPIRFWQHRRRLDKENVKRKDGFLFSSQFQIRYMSASKNCSLSYT